MLPGQHRPGHSLDTQSHPGAALFLRAVHHSRTPTGLATPHHSRSSGTAPSHPQSRAGSSASLTFTPPQHSIGQSSSPPGHSGSPSNASDSSPPTYTSVVAPPARSRATTAVGSSPRQRRPYNRRRSNTSLEMSAPSCSPPPYSLTPPDPNPAAPVPRAASSPHLRAPPSVHFSSSSSTPSSSSLAPCPIPAPHPQRGRASLSEPPLRIRADTSDEDPDAETPPSDDSILYTTSTLSFSGTLRSRLLGKRKGRAHEDTNVRPITTAPGVVGAGETETESEDSPRNLPTARITNPALAPLTFRPWLVTFLFSFSRLLSIVPAVLGTIWNVYHIVFPPGGPAALDWRVQFFVSTLWSILTGWQCLQLTTGLLKRWQVYYSPFATLIRLFALQAICWPATHITLSVLDHAKRPALCWAVIGTTTCCSRSIQLWVTSNIGPAPAPPPRTAPAPPSSLRRSVLASAGGMREEWMKLRRRRWDWGEVCRKCVLPAGVVYFVMAWAEMLRREWEMSRC